MNRRPTKLVRRGGVVPLVALLMIPLCGMMAFSVDLTHIVLTNATSSGPGGFEH